ncbi:MAG: WD40/YVTN/BNR-like repeat-containing protein, partial [Salibacteraceae bacterium]
MQRAFVPLMGLALVSLLLFVGTPSQQKIHTPLFSGTPLSAGGPEDPDARARFEWERLQDPATGDIPKNMRMRELAYAQSLPQKADRSGYTFAPMGPWNVGGRTRAFGVDVNNEDHLLAGGVSGGMWQSTDGGQSWTKTTAPADHHSSTCLIQDTRPGKTDIWYYGSGEVIGNSASASFSANYLGNGLYKSTDNGQSWTSLPATVTGDPQATDPWDLIWDVVIDASNTTEDELYAAANGKVFRSIDGGTSWTEVLGSSGLLSTFMDLAITSTGVVYATLSSNGASAGVWRSPDGINWTQIDQGINNFPGTYGRLLLAVNPQNENSILMMGNTPGSGLLTNVFFSSTAWTSLWKYVYKTGDGSGSDGTWTDYSANLPNNLGVFGNFYSQGSYDLALAYKPSDTNTVFIGGTYLYRSTDGFTSPNNISWVGGYEPGN